MNLRWSVAFILVGLLAVGLLYDRLVPASSDGTNVETTQLVVSPSMVDPPRLDVAWYCPVGSSSVGGYADHVVNIANLADESAVANLTIITDQGPGPRRRIELAPLSTQRIALSDIQSSEVAGAVVEIIGGRGAVGHTLTTETGVAEGPCATEASNSWYFAAGRTKADARELLVLMNPFPETARFDVEFQGLGRSRQPGELQGAFVEARSIRVIEVNPVITDEDSVAATVTTNRGRLVVERLQLLDGQLGPSGAAVQLGVPTPAPSWMFTAGRVHGDGDDLLTIYNPYEPDLSDVALTPPEDPDDTTSDDTTSDEIAADDGTADGAASDEAAADPDPALTDEAGTTTVSVELWPSNPTDLSSYSVVTIEREVRPGTFVTIDLRAQAERFEFPLPYELGVFVTSNEGLPIVAERWQFADRLQLDGVAAAATPDAEEAETEDGEAAPEGEDGEEGEEAVAPPELQAPEPVTSDLPQPIASEGVSTSRGNELFSTRWVIPWVTMVSDSTVIAVASAEEAAVEVRLLVNGQWEGPFRATVPAGGRAIIPVTSAAGGAAVEVTSNNPVSVEAMVVVPDASLDVVPAIPTVAG